MTADAARARLGVVGASGKMGSAVLRLADAAGFTVVCAVSVNDELGALGAARCAVVIDFSTPAGTRAVAELAARAGFALVSGTTGLDTSAERALDVAATKTAVLWEPNMSLGVHVLGVLLARAVHMLGPEYDIEIVETHHRMKADAPSGTATRLAEIAQAARKDAPGLVHGRHGRPGPRPAAEIGVHAVRGGDVIGDHVVGLFGAGERIELTHRASSRDLFAHGALRAASWIVGKSPGRYRLADVLGA